MPSETFRTGDLALMRADDGTVIVEHVAQPGSYTFIKPTVDFHLEIPALEWAVIVAHLSHSGATADAIDIANDLHFAPEATPQETTSGGEITSTEA